MSDRNRAIEPSLSSSADDTQLAPESERANVPVGAPVLTGASKKTAAELLSVMEEEELEAIEREAAALADDPSADARMARAVVTRLAQERALPTRDPAQVTASSPTDSASSAPLLGVGKWEVPRPIAPPPPGVQPKLSSPGLRRWAVLGSLLGAAAVLAVIVFSSSPGVSPPQPRYAIEVVGNAQVLGPEVPHVSLTPVLVSVDSALEVTLRPQAVHQEVLKLRAYLLQSGALTAFPAPFEQTPEGTFHLRELVEKLPPLAPGRWDLVVVIGPEDRLPAPVEIQRYAEDPAAARDGIFKPGWQLHRRSLRILPR